jgi:hypothetical protein
MKDHIAEVVRMKSAFVDGMERLVTKYEDLARCEPDFNQAENFRRIAKALKEIVREEAADRAASEAVKQSS